MKIFRFLAIAEGISYLSFGITMPLKYMMDLPQPNYLVGMAHGVLFIAYCFAVVWFGTEWKWSKQKIGVALAASLVPFMTFWIERKYLK